ncbi:MAG: S41 family peptidase [Candidatus Methylacidiphilales bacterium]
MHLRIAFLGFMFLATALCVATESEGNTEEARYRSALLFQNVLELVRDEYVDADKVDYDQLTQAALRGMLSSLDPHSQFLDSESFLEMRNDTEGEFGGLGITVGTENNRLTINMPIEGGPGFKAGLLPGDRILKIDGRLTDGLPLADAIKRLRGKPGEAVRLTIYRESSKEFKEIEVVREIIKIPTIRAVRLLSGPGLDAQKIGYLRITQFGEKTVEEFDSALRQLQNAGARAIILDLRNNYGGLLDAAVEVAGRFLPAGTEIVSTEGRPGSNKRQSFQARGRERLLDIPLAVLINGRSASGAEIVAGALKDLRRAILIGETTFGKGSVQTVQPLDLDPAKPIAVKLTTAKYYTPGRSVIHGVGIEPHILAPISLADEETLFLKQSSETLPPERRQKVEALPDTQLDRAVAALIGLKTYAERQPNGGRIQTAAGR